jgi:hypothetical protein
MQADDDSWLDGLAGNGKDPDKAASAEGRVLREMLRGAALDPDTSDHPAIADEDPAREAALINRARTAGILPAERAPAGFPSTRRWYSRWQVKLAAASIICMAIGVQLYSRFGEPTQTLRSAREGVIHISAADPVQLKHDLIRELGAAGVKAAGYESFGRQGIDADLPSPLPQAVREVLDRHGIPVPQDNILQVEIDIAAAR